MEKVSIIIPLYNGEKYITKTIKSCINQTYDNIEIIVIDDYSNDNGPSIVEGMISIDKRITLFRNKENRGIMESINHGIKISTGDYILPLGHDDLLKDLHVEVMIKNMSDTTSIVFCSSDLINSKDEV